MDLQYMDLSLFEINLLIEDAKFRKENATTYHDMVHYDWKIKELRKKRVALENQ